MFCCWILTAYKAAQYTDSGPISHFRCMQPTPAFDDSLQAHVNTQELLL